MADIPYLELADALVNNKRLSCYLFDVRDHTLCVYFRQVRSSGLVLKVLAHYVPQVDCLFWGNADVLRYVIDPKHIFACILKLKPSVFVFPIITEYTEPNADRLPKFCPTYISTTEKISFDYLWSELPPYYSIPVYKSNPERYLKIMSYFGLYSLVHEYFNSKVYFPSSKRCVRAIHPQDTVIYRRHEDVIIFHLETINPMEFPKKIVTINNLIRFIDMSYKVEGRSTAIAHSIALWVAQDVIPVGRVVRALKKIISTSSSEWAKPRLSVAVYWADIFSKLPIFNRNKSFMQIACKLLIDRLDEKLLT